MEIPQLLGDWAVDVEEFVVKLQVPEHQVKVVSARVGTPTAKRTQLRAVYFDTDDGRLAAAGIALRLRKEGRHWVQALKLDSAATSSRFEHNVVRAGVAEPGLDVALHQGSDAGAALMRAWHGTVAGASELPPLKERYRTDIMRTHRLLRMRGGTVELALDVGQIISGDLTWPIRELEIERVSGSASLVLESARQWIVRDGLWLDVRSKAERGHRLYLARLRTGKEQIIHDPQLGVAVPASMGPTWGSLSQRDSHNAPAFVQAVMRVSLGPVLRNASEMASDSHAPEHLHQFRIGLRRLRSLMRLCRGWVPPWGDSVTGALQETFEVLGRSRDLMVMQHRYGAALLAAGAPFSDWPAMSPAAEPSDPTTLMRQPSVNLALLHLLRYSLGLDTVSETVPLAHSDADTVRRIERRLGRWQETLVRESSRFVALDDVQRHELRKRIKRLRYALDASACLIQKNERSKKWDQYLSALAKAQTEMGSLSDLMTAQAYFREAAHLDSRYWFAVGWFSARLVQEGKRAQKALHELQAVKFPV